jgi:alkanesulfonate monooxygenase SsuD/methylene tetrahydromethanopterin reductase-like flavin-dependent oxidoreductase (luciferase family)
VELFLFLPQMRLSFDALVERAQVAEANGFTGLALIDHLAPPGAVDHPMYEAMVSATWVAAHTTSLRIGHLVLCDAMRHPAVLAKEAVSIDHASGGRFELGIGSGSVPEELVTYGVTTANERERFERMSESLAIITGLWNGDVVDHPGPLMPVTGRMQQPTPLGRIPIVIGGAGPRMMGLVARHADWWNVPVHRLARLDELRPSAGTARVSVQQMITYLPPGADHAAIAAAAEARFSWVGRRGRAVGDGPTLVRHLKDLEARGVERLYAWFTDFADPTNLRLFADEVVSHL